MGVAVPVIFLFFFIPYNYRLLLAAYSSPPPFKKKITFLRVTVPFMSVEERDFLFEGGWAAPRAGGSIFGFFFDFFLGPLLAAYQIAIEKTTLGFCEAIGRQ